MMKITLIVIGITIAIWWQYTQYQTIKKYYPELSYWEYIILHDKIRVIPE